MSWHVTLALISLLVAGCSSTETKKLDFILPERPGDFEWPPDDPRIDQYNQSFCMTFSYKSHDYFIYIENYAEVSTTSGTCERPGPAISADDISMYIRYKNTGRATHGCNGTSICTFSERSYLSGSSIYCLSAKATINGSSASETTNFVECPRL